MMLFNTAIIAGSYLLWYVTDNIILYFASNNSLNMNQSELFDVISRTIRLTCEVVAFRWILISFYSYGIKVDEQMH